MRGCIEERVHCSPAQVAMLLFRLGNLIDDFPNILSACARWVEDGCHEERAKVTGSSRPQSDGDEKCWCVRTLYEEEC